MDVNKTPKNRNSELIILEGSENYFLGIFDAVSKFKPRRALSEQNTEM